MRRVDRRGVPASWVAISAFFALVALPRSAVPLIDGDVYWHIRAGLEVLDTGRVPRYDHWSIVGDGMRWLSQDWLSNVLLGLGWRLGEIGPTVLSISWALLVVVSLAFLWWAVGLRRPNAGWLGRIVWLTFGVIVAGPVLGVRVQVVDLTLTGAVVACLWGYLARGRRVWLTGLPLISLLWANAHAGWPLLFLLGGAVVVGEATDRLLGRRAPDRVLDWPALFWLSGALAVSAVLIAINPNGLALYAYPLDTSSIAAHRDFISEWQSPDPGTFIGQAFIAFVAIVVVPALWVARRTMRMADALVIVGLTAMIIIGARFLLLAPIIAIAAGISLGPALASSRLGRRFEGVLRRLDTPRQSAKFTIVNALLIAVVVLAGSGVTWARVSPAAQAKLLVEHMPVAAVNWILANDPGSRPFNQYSWGGYLGLLRPETPIYIDGRSDIYGDEPIRAYADAVTLRTDPTRLLDEYAIDHVLFAVGQPFAGWLDGEPTWRRVFADDLAAVWVRANE